MDVFAVELQNNAEKRFLYRTTVRMLRCKRARLDHIFIGLAIFKDTKWIIFLQQKTWWCYLYLNWRNLMFKSSSVMKLRYSAGELFSSFPLDHSQNISKCSLFCSWFFIIPANKAARQPTTVWVTPSDIFKDTWGRFQPFLCDQNRLFFGWRQTISARDCDD